MHPSHHSGSGYPVAPTTTIKKVATKNRMICSTDGIRMFAAFTDRVSGPLPVADASSAGLRVADARDALVAANEPVTAIIVQTPHITDSKYRPQAPISRFSFAPFTGCI